MTSEAVCCVCGEKGHSGDWCVSDKRFETEDRLRKAIDLLQKNEAMFAARGRRRVIVECDDMADLFGIIRAHVEAGSTMKTVKE